MWSKICRRQTTTVTHSSVLRFDVPLKISIRQNEKKNNILWRLCFFTSCVVCVCSSCKSTDDPCVEYPTRIYTVNIFCCYCCRCGWLSFCIVAYICVKGASAVSEIIQKKGKEWSKIIIKQAVKQNNIHPVRRRRLCSCYLFKYIHHNSVR